MTITGANNGSAANYHDGRKRQEKTGAGVIHNAAANQQRLFEVEATMQHPGQMAAPMQSSSQQHCENLMDMEGDNFVDGRIPQANVSSYNSHQSNKKLAFQAKFG